MRNIIGIGVLALALAGLGCLAPSSSAQTEATRAAPPAAQANLPPPTDVPVNIVVLYSSGVGYFEHVGTVSGDATTELRFKTHQINDILKSLVLQDTTGNVASVIYPSQDPLAKTLKSFQVDLTSNPALADLLNQLRGAKVKIDSELGKLTGTILGLEKKPQAVEKGQIEVWQLNLVLDGVIRSLRLESVNSIELDDAHLQQELGRALAAVAQARHQDKKPVSIRFQGQGQRPVHIAYVIETPIWKTSYRLLLPANPQDKASLQGWAIVENQTDNDWNQVQLSLVSGWPISFIQELYQPLYLPRPVLYPELFTSLKPQTYEAGTDTPTPPAKTELKEGDDAPMAPRAVEPPDNRTVVGKKVSTTPESAARPPVSTRDKVTDAIDKNLDVTASVASIASATKLGELFKYTVANVTLPRQQSAMIPIITDPIEVEKLSIYNPSVLSKNPLTGALLKNTTDKHLLQGPVTVLEGSSYAGDARIDNLPPGQQRLLSYGIDLQMLMNATKNNQEISIASAKIVKGVLDLQRKHLFAQEYLAVNKDTSDKTLVIEHPFRQGWKLVEPPKPMETTETLYRFRTSVPAGQSAMFMVKEEIFQSETITILPADFTTLEAYARNAQIPKNVRDALAKAAAIKQSMTDAQRQADQRKNEISQLTQDETRIRENIKAVPPKSAQQTRLLEELDEHDKQIKSLYEEMKTSQKAYEQARKGLEDYLKNLTIEN